MVHIKNRSRIRRKSNVDRSTKEKVINAGNGWSPSWVSTDITTTEMSMPSEKFPKKL